MTTGSDGNELIEIQDRIAEVVAGLDLPPAARLEGVRMAEAWINEVHAFDSQFPSIAVEIPFFFFPEKFTIVVGCMDRIIPVETRPPAGKFTQINSAATLGIGSSTVFDIAGCEWKTAKGTTKFWNEDKWLKKMRDGHQTKIYALAMHEGFFVINEENCPEPPPGKITIPSLGSTFSLWEPRVRSPRIMVRAITKENPPQIWPSEGQKFLEFSPHDLSATRNALAIKGAQIRTAKMSGLIPWQLPGLQCQNRFSHTDCPYLRKFCEKHQHPVIEFPPMPGPTDPGLQALKAAGEMLRVPLDDPRVVVLSASSYESVSNCMEFYRVMNQFPEEGAYQEALDTGGAFHAAVKTYYQGMARRKK